MFKIIILLINIMKCLDFLNVELSSVIQNEKECMVVKVINTEKSVQTEKFYLLFQQHF
jgi:hypothetical protein